MPACSICAAVVRDGSYFKLGERVTCIKCSLKGGSMSDAPRGMSLEALARALEQDLKEPREGGPGPRKPETGIPSPQAVVLAMMDYPIGTVVRVTNDGVTIDCGGAMERAAAASDSAHETRLERQLAVLEESDRRAKDAADNGTRYDRHRLRACMAAELLGSAMMGLGGLINEAIVRDAVRFTDALLAELERNAKPAEHGYCEVENG